MEPSYQRSSVGEMSALRRENRQELPGRSSMQRREAGRGWFKLSDDQTRPGDPDGAAELYTAQRRDLYFPLPIVRADDVPASRREVKTQSEQAIRARQTADLISGRCFWFRLQLERPSFLGNKTRCRHNRAAEDSPTGVWMSPKNNTRGPIAVVIGLVTKDQKGPVESKRDSYV